MHGEAEEAGHHGDNPSEDDLVTAKTVTCSPRATGDKHGV